MNEPEHGDMILGRDTLCSCQEIIEQSEAQCGDMLAFWQGMFPAFYGFAQSSLGIEAVRAIHAEITAMLANADSIGKPIQ